VEKIAFLFSLKVSIFYNVSVGAHADYSYDDFPESGRPFFITNLNCRGNETLLFNCSHNEYNLNNARSSYNPVRVICQDNQTTGGHPPCNSGSVRLGNSTDDGRRMEGRIEVCTGGIWTTLCNSGGSSNYSRVICRQILGEPASGKCMATALVSVKCIKTTSFFVVFFSDSPTETETSDEFILKKKKAAGYLYMLLFSVILTLNQQTLLCNCIKFGMLKFKRMLAVNENHVVDCLTHIQFTLAFIYQKTIDISQYHCVLHHAIVPTRMGF